MNIDVLAFLVPSGDAAGLAAGLAVESDELGALVTEEGPDVPELLAALRVCVARTSAIAFSLIAFCFSSSFARIGTKSSGIGLLS